MSLSQSDLWSSILYLISFGILALLTISMESNTQLSSLHRTGHVSLFQSRRREHTFYLAGVAKTSSSTHLKETFAPLHGLTYLTLCHLMTLEAPQSVPLCKEFLPKKRGLPHFKH